MKLIYKFILWYLLISLGVFVVGGVMTYQIVKKEIDLEQERFLEERLTFVNRMVENRKPDKILIRDKIRIEPLAAGTQETEIKYSDTLVMHSTLERMEPHTKLEVVKIIQGRPYKISLYDVIVEQDDIVESVRESMIKVYLLLVGAILLLGAFAGMYLLKPFNQTLNSIQNFYLDDGKPISNPEHTGTLEFDKLNKFLGEMTAKIQSDYNSLKEFSENASHEMQTPLANAIGKLELLLDNNSLSENESVKILAALDSLKHLSKMSHSLGLITKIQNREFRNIEPLDFSEIVNQALQNFQELIELKSLCLETRIEPGVTVTMDPYLATILINNLMSNAIRHNYEKGKIRTKLDQNGFVICNTGKVPESEPELMFERFKKDCQSQEGMGLGLAIVKKICDISGFGLTYSYEIGEHRLEMNFKN